MAALGLKPSKFLPGSGPNVTGVSCSSDAACSSLPDWDERCRSEASLTAAPSSGSVAEHGRYVFHADVFLTWRGGHKGPT